MWWILLKFATARKATIEAAKRIINSDKVCRSYSDLNFGVTFLEHSVYEPNSRKSLISTAMLKNPSEEFRSASIGG